MDLIQILLGATIPAIGAAFVWMLNIARNDPNLFKEIDKVVRPRIRSSIFWVFLMGLANFFMHGGPGKEEKFFTDDRILLVALVVFIVYCLISLHNSLEFFQRVSELPSRNSQSQQQATGK